MILTKTADITTQHVDAIVNAANSSLLGGGGVDGAIHHAGGSEILQACQELRRTAYTDGLPTGEAVATTAGKLSATYVIHTVGPIYTRCKPHCAQQLANCYRNALKVALALKCHSVAFPAISTGIYGYPKEEAARIAYETVTAFLAQGVEMKVYFIFHSAANEDLFKSVNQLP